MTARTNYSEGSAASFDLVGCHRCTAINEIELNRCKRCNASLHPRRQASIQYTLALLITAIVCYIPANTLPMLSTRLLGNDSAATIVADGLHRDGWIQDTPGTMLIEFAFLDHHVTVVAVV